MINDDFDEFGREGRGECTTPREEERLERLLGGRDARNLPPAEDEPLKIEFNMTPTQVKALLDKDVINQDKAKKYISNAICYHYARIKRALENGQTYDAANKKNLLLVGSTGCGKTYLVNKASKIVGVPFVKADATKFSETGYVGGNVESMITDLFIKAEGNIKLAECGIVYLDEINKIRSEGGYGRDVSGTGVQNNLLKLMEETEVDIPTNPPSKFNTKNVLFIMGGTFNGLSRIVKKRIRNDDDWEDNLTAEDFVTYGFEPEFVGRLPLRVVMKTLNENDLYQILKESGDSIIQQYVGDLDAYGIKAQFTDDALRSFAYKAAQEGTGARALTGVIENTLFEFLYELPSSGIKEIEIDRHLVNNPKDRLVEITLSSTVSRVLNEYQQKYDVEFKLPADAVAEIGNKSLEEGLSIDNVTRNVLDAYVDTMKLYQKKSFNIPVNAVLNPKKYLEGIKKK